MLNLCNLWFIHTRQECRVYLAVLLFVTVLTEPFFTFVRRHFMPFSFLTAGQ